MHSLELIPKKLHYIWLGKGKKPKSFDLALQSWKEFAPGYSIEEWSENNISEFDLPAYYFELVKNKKWAFAADILRFYILKKYGGLYFDVDQILIKHIPDNFLEYDFFISRYHEVDDYYGFGLLGSKKGFIFFEKMIDFYRQYNGLDIIVNTIGSKEIDSLVATGLYNIKIFPQEYFYPLSKVDFTNNTYSYHLANTSWVPAYKKFLQKLPGYVFAKNLALKYAPQSIKNRIFSTKYL